MRAIHHSSPAVRLLTPVLAAVLGLAVLPIPAAAWDVSAGWTQSDVGLHDKGEGIYLGIGRHIAWDNPILDANFSVDYVQRKGSQPTPFADPVAGFQVQDAEVTLHMVQPALFVGARIPSLPVGPRLYTGSSVALKLKESWSDFPGVPDQAYGYKETDIVFHLGLSVAAGPVTLDARWSKSMVGQLLQDEQALPLFTPDKAEDSLAGVADPQLGYKTEVWQVGAGFSF